MLLYDKLVIIEVKRQAMKRLVSIFVLLFFSISAKCGDNSCRNLEFEEHVKDIMQKTNFSNSYVRKVLTALSQKELIEHRGSKKTGGYFSREQN